MLSLLRRYWPVVIICLIPVGYVLCTKVAKPVLVKMIPATNFQYTLETDQKYQVKRVKVLEGHRFDVYLENKKRYLVSLDGVIGTPPEAKDSVVRLLNESQEKGHPLTIIPRRWNDCQFCWMVDVYFDSQNVTLTEWLKARELVYSR